jgi:ribosomal protein L7/L12
MSDDSSGWRRLSWPRPLRISREAAQDADRRAGEQLANLLDERDRAEIENLLAAEKPIPAVRRVRELTGLRLIDAKRLVESLQHQSRMRSARLDL